MGGVNWRAGAGAAVVPAGTTKEPTVAAARRASDSPDWGGPRPGAGRPQLFKKPVHVKLTLPQLVLDALDAFAEEHGIKRSDAIRRLLSKHKPIAEAFKQAEL